MDVKLRRRRKNYKNYQKMEEHCMDMLRGKIEFLLSEYGLDETCRMSTSAVENVLNILRKNGKENAIIEYRIKRCGIEKNYVLLGVNDQVIKINLKPGIAELTNCTRTINLEDKPTEYIDLDDLSYDKIEENHVYTLDDFIADTNFSIKSKRVLPQFRPGIVCKDGYMISVQASRFSACKPRQDNRTDYTHFEVSGIYEDIPELQPYQKSVFKWDRMTRSIYEYVPKHIVEAILEEHGGIDEEKTFLPPLLNHTYNNYLGVNIRNNYLDGVLEKVDRFEELNREDEEELEEIDEYEEDFEI